MALPGQGWVGLGENRDPRAKGQGWPWVIRGVILRCYCSRRISIAAFMEDEVLEWNLMFDDILYEKYLWLKPFGELGLVVDSSCLSPWVGEPVTPAGGYHTSVDVWLTGTYHA